MTPPTLSTRMKTEQELDELADSITARHGIWSDPERLRVRKLLRSIQIDAMREARETVAREARRDEVCLHCVPQLDKLIRELELK